MYNIGCGICEDLKLESISEITETCSNKLVDLRLQALNVQACLPISFTLYLSRSRSIVTDFRGLRVSVAGWLGSRAVSERTIMRHSRSCGTDLTRANRDLIRRHNASVFDLRLSTTADVRECGRFAPSL